MASVNDRLHKNELALARCCITYTLTNRMCVTLSVLLHQLIFHFIKYDRAEEGNDGLQVIRK